VLKCALLSCFPAARRWPRALKVPAAAEAAACFAQPSLTLRPVQVMMQRLMSRAASSGRVDDNLEVIRKRFR